MRVRHVFLKALLSGVSLLAASGSPVCADPAEHVSDIGDQRRVNVTIFNGSMALVHDLRSIDLTRGENRIAWRDVSANMDATSAILADLSVPGDTSVLEQNFNFDLLNPASVLDKYVGRTVTVVHPHPLRGQPEREKATLLSDNGGAVLQYADRVETSVQDGYLVYPAIPSDLRDRPTLVLDFQSEHGGKQSLDLTYITGGLAWQANYIGVVAPDEKHMDLSGLVTLSNTSGTTFRNAHMQLVAGNVNAALPQQTFVPAQTVDTYTVSGQRQVTQENYFEYHLYTLQRTTTIGNNQTKQVALLSAHHVPITKTLELRGGGDYYESRNGDLGQNLKVGVYETFTNKGGDLGIPLPGGIVRLYKNDSAGRSQFLGSDSIEHTPRNEDVRMHLGDSFDVTANKKQTDYHELHCIDVSSYAITLKNAKPESADVLVVEPIPGDWTIADESLPHQKTSSTTATWTVHVPADSHALLTYTARVKLCP